MPEEESVVVRVASEPPEREATPVEVDAVETATTHSAKRKRFFTIGKSNFYGN
jgi:hypothetical protein